MEEKVSILLVEDEEKIRSALTDFLEFHNFEVTEAADASSALDFDIPFDAYLIDLSLPDRDGMGLAQLIEKRFGEVPVVLLTGFMSDGIEKEAKDQNISAVIKKARIKVSIFNSK